MLATSPPAYTPLRTGRERGVDAEQRAAALEVARIGAEFGILPDRRDDRVGLEPERTVGERLDAELPALGARHELDLHAAQCDRAALADRAFEHRAVAQCDAFLDRLVDLVAMRGHLCAALERDDRDLVPGAQRAARGVDRRAAAADHDDPLAQRRRRAGIGLRQVLRAVDHPGLGRVELRQTLGPACADGDVDRVELRANLAQRRFVVDRFVASDLDSHRRDASDLAIEHVARESVGGDSVAHQPAEFGHRLVDRHRIPKAAQLVRGRKPGRAAADHRDALRAGRSRQRGTTSPQPARRRPRGARAGRSRAPRRSSRGCRRFRRGGGRCARRSRETGCCASASATRRESRVRARARSTARCRRPPGRPRGTARGPRRSAAGTRATCRCGSPRWMPVVQVVGGRSLAFMRHSVAAACPRTGNLRRRRRRSRPFSSAPRRAACVRAPRGRVPRSRARARRAAPS